MKKILFILMCIPCFVFSQKYFLLDSLKNHFRIETFTLDTSELYGIRKNINVYNVHLTKHDILLLTVLPDLDERILPGTDERGQNWTILDVGKLKKEDIISKSKVKEIASDWMASNTPDKKTMDFRVVKKVNDSYYVSKMCLTELFRITSLKTPFISSYGSLNIAEPKTTIKEVEKSFKEQFPNRKFIMDVTDIDYLKNLDDPFSFRNYLSKEYTIQGKKAYQFWTFDGWWIIDGYNEHRGIDRLVYMPEKGIVGGSYDFYFRYRSRISDYKLWNNIVNEKVMIAEEVK
ncbi:hypothetical protein [Chryseobacterium sp. MYb328]|uniref:hypothetical protein n=1 Tax=Chryseobacterium sp. MYb328 TaxID=2745231 RepID=UPI0030B18B3E